eukprot:464521-Lingulodinium_polyedra.AAC.1
MFLHRSDLSDAAQRACSEATSVFGLPGFQLVQKSWDQELAVLAHARSSYKADRPGPMLRRQGL